MASKQHIDAGDWHMDTKTQNEWVCHTAQQLRVMARHVQQAWEADSSDDSDDEDPWGEEAGEHLVNLVLDLVYVGKLSANDDELDEEAMEADEDFGYIVGWDPEHNNAWRMATTAASPTREFATKVECPPGAGDEDLMVGTWDDGVTSEISGYTCGDFRQRSKGQCAERGHDSKGVFRSWRTQTTDGKTVFIKKRVHQGKQLLAISDSEGPGDSFRGCGLFLGQASIKEKQRKLEA